MIKRIFDLSISIIALILVLPIFIMVVFILSLFRKNGSVFFIQSRKGLHGANIKVFKFRTMIKSYNSTVMFSPGDDSRITIFGRFLRKTKLDELPQLINVLKGDMSIVGPRPEVKEWAEIYPEKWKIVHSVKPGITDNASIEFRNEEEILAASVDPIKTYREVILPRKLDLYLDYVNNRSFWGDLKIILKTIKVVVKG